MPSPRVLRQTIQQGGIYVVSRSDASRCKSQTHSDPPFPEDQITGLPNFKNFLYLCLMIYSVKFLDRNTLSFLSQRPKLQYFPQRTIDEYSMNSYMYTVYTSDRGCFEYFITIHLRG
jgi:hypothetical protein